MRSGEERGERYDTMIGGALRSYAEPAAIPETRVVLARVMERARELEPQRNGWQVWSVAAAVGLAAVVILGAVWMMQSSRRVEITWVPKAPGVARLAAGQSVDAGMKTDHGIESTPRWPRSDIGPRYGSARNMRIQGGRTAYQESQENAMNHPPKLEVFPTPRPLSPDEQALVSFTTRASAPVKKAVIEDQQHWDDPIIVADLKNPQLETGGQQNP